MRRLLRFWRFLCVDSDLQFRFVLTLVVLVFLEGAFVGRGISELFDMALDWRRPNWLWDFFGTALSLLLPLFAVNVLVGLYGSARYLRPLKELERGLRELREGRLSTHLELDGRDALWPLTRGFNETARSLERLIRRDRRFVVEAMRALEEGASTRPKDLKKILLSVRSRLSIVNAHFTKDDHPRE